MGYIILAIIFIVLGLSLPGFISKERYGWLRRTIPTLFAIIAFFFIFATSFVIIDADKVGHLKRIYLDKKMPPGQIIAFQFNRVSEVNVGRMVGRPGLEKTPFTHQIRIGKR